MSDDTPMIAANDLVEDRPPAPSDLGAPPGVRRVEGGADRQPYLDLRRSVSASLDIAAGVADIVNAASYASLGSDVARHLDLDAGLYAALAVLRQREEQQQEQDELTLGQPEATNSGGKQLGGPGGGHIRLRGAGLRVMTGDHDAQVLTIEPKVTDVPDELVALAMTGDRRVVGHVLSLIRPMVLRYCRARLGQMARSSVAADDVAQEVCLAVLTALPGYRRQGRPFLAFVYGIASHKVIDAHRAAARTRSEPVADVPDSMESADGPEQRALGVELTSEMARLLDELPDKQREVLVLRVVVGLSAEKTAEVVGSTSGAVRVAQHRALARLRKLMVDEEVV